MIRKKMEPWCPRTAALPALRLGLYPRSYCAVAALLTVAACGGGDQLLPAPPGKIPVAACPIPMPSVPTGIIGGWVGKWTQTQSVSGNTEQTELPAFLTMDTNGYPQGQLAALGFVLDWWVPLAADCAPIPDPQDLFVVGSSREVVASHLTDMRQTGNPIRVHTTELSLTFDTLRWSYDASYRVADLLHYKPNGYRNAPYVQVTATELYTLSGTDLVVNATASGQDETGQPVSFSLVGTLQPGGHIYPKSRAF